jgi:hypothetical protein
MLPRAAFARGDFQSGREKQRRQSALLKHITANATIKKGTIQLRDKRTYLSKVDLPQSKHSKCLEKYSRTLLQ